VLVEETNGLNDWSGKHNSIVGTFVDFTSIATDEIELQLEVIWENGYVPFLNLTTLDSYFTAKRIAEGEADNYLREVARSFAMFAKEGEQMAYVAPLHEMNGSWAPYQGDPTNFILSYKRIQQIFAEEGVPDQSVAWVFAPNGSSAPATPEMELYYPGDAFVDYTGFTAYNFGYCTAIDPKWRGWSDPEKAVGGYLNRMIALAPSKPVIIAQTGTTALRQSGYTDDAAKNAWLTELYDYLAGYPQIHAVLYYNRWDSDCDWAVYDPNGKKYDGYIEGISNPAIGYFTQFQQLGFFSP
jgi:beta-mannanase